MSDPRADLAMTAAKRFSSSGVTVLGSNAIVEGLRVGATPLF